MLDAAQRYMLENPDTVINVRNDAERTFDRFYEDVIAGDAEPVDIFRIDVIDTGKFAPHLLDLSSSEAI